jgi:hypothetical protein
LVSFGQFHLVPGWRYRAPRYYWTGGPRKTDGAVGRGCGSGVCEKCTWYIFGPF